MKSGKRPEIKLWRVAIEVFVWLFLFQFVLAATLSIGYVLEGNASEMGRRQVLQFPNHRYLAWTGLCTLVITMPFAGWIGTLAIRNHPLVKRMLKEGWTPIIVGFAGGLLLAVFSVCLVILLGYGRIEAGPLRLAPPELAASILGYGLVMLVVGYYEELLFRGLLMIESIRRLRNREAGITLTGLLFGLMHTVNIDGTPMEHVRIVVSGILFSWLLAVVMLRFRSLRAAMGLHAGWNYGLAGLMGCVVSGHPANFTIFRTNVSGPAWVSGDSFGLETSLLVQFIVLLITVLLWRKTDFLLATGDNDESD
ncbi:CPBP family intramembrane metalloprotease [bacterium]|nr:CPBP family intramembrane metalloprotease [candidate division CSSED10-310 bacterium]